MLARSGAPFARDAPRKRLTRRALATRARVSERFLMQLESGRATSRLARLAEVAEALGTTPARLAQATLPAPSPARSAAPEFIALLGVRGAGKSAIGEIVARRLKIRSWSSTRSSPATQA